MKRFLICAAMLFPAARSFAQDQKKAPPPPPLMMMIPDLKDGTELPVKFSCSNAPSGVSPHIQWTNTPPNTQSFALLLHDPEPHPRGSIYDITHWFIYNIPANVTELPEGVKNGDLPNGAKQIKGARGFAGYFGPCAPPGPDHHYTFQLFALDTKLDLGPEATRADAEKAMDGHILGAGVFVQMFHRAQ
jgi:Raf kinase inhibitor-like YbhB/YbcL family protein